ncbi:UNVERIFIED_ORG: hypothetical protein FHU01_2716 [Citrobacter freundii]
MGFSYLMPEHLLLFTDNSSTLPVIKEHWCLRFIQGLL